LLERELGSLEALEVEVQPQLERMLGVLEQLDKEAQADQISHLGILVAVAVRVLLVEMAILELILPDQAVVEHYLQLLDHQSVEREVAVEVVVVELQGLGERMAAERVPFLGMEFLEQ
jgi:hypothetical protein